MEVHTVLRLPRNLRVEVHTVLCLPRNLRMEVHKVLRLPRNLRMEVHKALRLPRNLRVEVHKVLRLPRNLKLYYKVASSHLPAPQILRVLKLYYSTKVVLQSPVLIFQLPRYSAY